MRRAVRWVLRVFATLAGLCVVSVIALVIFVHTDCGRNRVRHTLEDELHATFPGGASIGRLDGSPFTELVAHEVVLNTADGQRMVRIGTLRIRLAVWTLVHHVARIDRLVADDVDVRVTGAPLSNEPPEPSEPSSWTVDLRALEVHRAHVVVDGAAELTDLELTGKLAIPAGGPIGTELQLTGTWQHQHVAAEVEATLGERVSVPHATASVGALQVAAHDVIVDGERPAGHVTIDAPAAVVRAIAPPQALALLGKLELPDAHVEIAASGTDAEVEGRFGTATLHALVHGDLPARRGSAVISLRDVDAAALTRGAIDARGDALAAVGYDGAVVSGMIYAHGAYGPYPAGDANIAVHGTPDAATVTVLASGAGGAQLAAIAERAGNQTRAHVVATVADLAAASGNQPELPVAGKLALDATAEGTLQPFVTDVIGTLDGKALRWDTTTVAHAVASLDASLGPIGNFGATHATLTGVASAGTPTGSFVVDARNCERNYVLLVSRRAHALEDRPRCDGDKIIAQVDARPAAAPVAIDAGVVVTLDTPGMLADIALGGHRVRLPDGQVWAGSGGRVTVTTEKHVAVRGLHSANGPASLDVTADYDAPTLALDAHADAKGLPAVMLDARYQGSASGSLDLHRRGASWRGGGTLDAKGLVLGPEIPTIDGTAQLVIAGRRVTLDADATAAQVGGVHATVEVEGPPDLLDTAAWRALPRTAIRDATVTVRHADLAGVAPDLGGTVEGKVTLAGPQTGGALAVRGVATPIGTAEADVAFAPQAAQLGATTSARVAGFGDATVQTSFVVPEHPFDPAAWQQLGRGVLGGLDASVDNVIVAEGQLARLGIPKAPYRGRLDAKLHVTPGATGATLDAHLRDVQGGIVARPLVVHVTAGADGGGTRGSLIVRDQKTHLAELTVELPVTLERWLAAPKLVAKTAPLRGTLAIPELAAPAVTGIVGGGTYVIGGGISGQASIGGTLGTPTGHATLRAHDVVVAPSLSGRAVPRLDELTVAVDWGGASGSATVHGKESDGGWLDITANGRPSDPASIVGSLGINKFDLAPFAAFLPGRYAAATGHLSGNVSVRGVDRSGAMRGWVRVDDMTVPLHPLLGTATGGSAQLTVDDKAFKLKVKSELGRGKLTLDATAPRDVATIDATLVLDKIQPIIEEQPRIDARITATAKREGGIWHARATVANGAHVYVPDTQRTELLDEDTPPDLYFVDEGLPLSGFREPEKPWLYLDIGFANVGVESRYLANVDASIYGQLELDIGETIGVFGNIGIDRGTADLFGRRYVVEDGPDKVRFDGDLDPLLDLYLETTDIPDLRLGASVSGRLEDITEGRQKAATFSSSPALYNEGQLLAFFLGGSPGAEGQAVGGALGGALQSSDWGRRIKNRLPLSPDVAYCAPGGPATGTACTLGKWYASHRVFVGYKQRLEARPDENTFDVEGQAYLSRAWSIEVSGGDRLYLGGDLLWRHRWR